MTRMVGVRDVSIDSRPSHSAQPMGHDYSYISQWARKRRQGNSYPDTPPPRMDTPAKATVPVNKASAFPTTPLTQHKPVRRTFNSFFEATSSRFTDKAQCAYAVASRSGRRRAKLRSWIRCRSKASLPSQLSRPSESQQGAGAATYVQLRDSAMERCSRPASSPHPKWGWPKPRRPFTKNLRGRRSTRNCGRSSVDPEMGRAPREPSYNTTVPTGCGRAEACGSSPAPLSR